MGYFFGCGNACNENGGGGSGAGKYLSANLPAGISDSFNPGGIWPTGVGRLDLVPAGDATLNSLVAGIDGQEVIIRNASATFTITIPAGGPGAVSFTGGGGGSFLPPLTPMTCVYYGGSINQWVIVQ
jgi:hypothetical protein